MKIGDRCFVHGYIDEIRKDTVIIRNKGGYFGTDPGEVIVVNDTAHPNWIHVSERLPEEPFGCLVTVWDTNPVTMDEFENILPYFVGWDGEQWNDGDGEQCPFEVIAWMPLPEPWEGEKHE